MSLQLIKSSLTLYFIAVTGFNQFVPITYWSGNNGISSLYNLTSLCLRLEFWVALALIYTTRKGSFYARTILIVLVLKTILDRCNASHYIFTSVNIGLLNPIGQYHPPMLYTYVIYLFCTLENNTRTHCPQHRPIRHANKIHWLLLSLLLSAWWANQELFWGNFWNWDPVEMSSIVFFTLSVYQNHSTIKNLTAGKIKYITTMWLFGFLVAYLVVRGPLANSVHSFTNSHWMRIDRRLFHTTIASIAVGIATSLYLLPKYHGRGSVYKYLWYAASTYPLTLVIVLGITNGVGYQIPIKYVITAIMLCVYLSKYSPIKVLKMVPKDWAHYSITCVLLITILVWEAPQKTLLITRPYLESFTVHIRQLQLSIQNTYTNAHTYELIKLKSTWKTRHGARIVPMVGTQVSTKSYARSMARTYFMSVSTRLPN